MIREQYYLSEVQEKNLETLAAYLEKLPVNYRHFSMDHWIDCANYNLTTKYAIENGGVEQFGCGTTACAIGHGPAAGILAGPDDMSFDQRINWWQYGHSHFFGSLNAFATGEVYDWCFHDRWSRADNTHRGAAARIRYLLAGNEIPIDEYSNVVVDKDIYKEYLVTD